MRSTSQALERWQSERCGALDSLEHVHGKTTEKRRGRQYATEHLNLALFVSLAAQFQGFCRDLHDDAATQIAASLAPGNDDQIPIVLNSFIRKRQLDFGNAHYKSLGDDFAILGMTFWQDVKSTYPSHGVRWHRTLDTLNGVRNAAVHSEPAKLARARADQPLTLRTFRRWRSSLNGAATGFDKVVGAYLLDLTGTGWDE